MKTNALFITVSAALMALAMLFLYVGNLFPAARVAAVAAASLMTIAAVIESGICSGVLVYIGSAVIGSLFLPDKASAYLYAVFFGLYPIAKSLCERLKPVAIQWALKIVFFNMSFAAVWFVFRSLVFTAESLKRITDMGEIGLLIAYMAANAAFILYDIGLTRLIGLYILRISKNLRKTK